VLVGCTIRQRMESLCRNECRYITSRGNPAQTRHRQDGRTDATPRRFLSTLSISVDIVTVRVPGYRSRGPGSIPFATRFSEK
jgi:hypothetical protein